MRNLSTVPVHTLTTQTTRQYHHSLEITTTVSLVTQTTHGKIIFCMLHDDPLWDGQRCEGVCYDNGKSPPWFSVELPNPTIDEIEVRICSSECTYQDAIVQLMEIYIQ